MANLKCDLFENFTEINKIKTNTIDEKSKLCLLQDIEVKILADIADKVNNLKNKKEDYDSINECVVRTDTKYFNYIRRIEMNMFLESKRRVKTRRLENSPEKKESESVRSIKSNTSTLRKGNKDEEKSLKKENLIEDVSFAVDNSTTQNNKRIHGKEKKDQNNVEEYLKRKSPRADNSSNRGEILQVKVKNEDLNMTEGKALRSKNNSKSTLQKCYEKYYNSENVMKSIKSRRRRAPNCRLVEAVHENDVCVDVGGDSAMKTIHVNIY